MKKAKRIVVKLQKGRRLVKHSNGTWYLETFVNLQQKRRSLGTSDLKEAMAIQDKLKSADEELPAQPEPEAPKTAAEILTLTKAADEYLAWYERNNRPSSFERTEPFIRSFVDSLGKQRDPKTLQRADVQKFITNRVAKCSAHTVRTDFNRVRAFLYWVADMKAAADRSICRRIDLPKPKRGAKAAPSTEKIRAVIRALGDAWIGEYFRVLVETGARPSEVLGIRGTDLRDAKDAAGRPVKSLRIAPTDDRDLKTEASERVILLSPVAGEILQRRKDALFKKDLPLFPNSVGEVFQENSVYHIFRETLAGGKGKPVPAELDVTLYDARHFFCSEHAAPGPQHMDMAALGAYIGHAAASTQTLAKWYVDQNALRRGAPATLIEQTDGEVVEMKQANR